MPAERDIERRRSPAGKFKPKEYKIKTGPPPSPAKHWRKIARGSETETLNIILMS